MPVVGYGTDELPAFYSTTSGLRLPHRVDGPAAAAAAIAAHRSIPGAGGILIVQPPPADLAIEPRRGGGLDRGGDGRRGTPGDPRRRRHAPPPRVARAGVGRADAARQHRSDRRQCAHRGCDRIGLDLTAGGAMLARTPCASTKAARASSGKRSCGASVRSPIGRQLKELLLLELEVGFVLQGIGLQAGGADSDSFGSAVKRTYELTDDQVAELMDVASPTAEPRPRTSRMRRSRTTTSTRCGCSGAASTRRRRTTSSSSSRTARSCCASSASPGTGSGHQLAEFTRDEILAMIESAPELRQQLRAKARRRTLEGESE